jgi:hypothetical protein
MSLAAPTVVAFSEKGNDAGFITVASAQVSDAAAEKSDWPATTARDAFARGNRLIDVNAIKIAMSENARSLIGLSEGLDSKYMTTSLRFTRKYPEGWHTLTSSTRQRGRTQFTCYSPDYWACGGRIID